MNRLIKILALSLFCVAGFAQTPVTSIEIDTSYLQGVENGKSVLYNTSDFISGSGTDDQTIDTLQLNGTTLEISLEGDNEPLQTVDLSSLSGGGGGSGTTEYYFGGYSTQTATITQDVWTDVTINIETIEQASFTHTGTSASITLDSAGVYMISANINFNQGATRVDGSSRFQVDTGGGFGDLTGGVGYGSFGTETFAAAAIDTRCMTISPFMYSASAGDIIKLQAYVDNAGDWAFASGSTVTIVRID